jgi:peptidyl-prolyl cis-trans isomerase C
MGRSIAGLARTCAVAGVLCIAGAAAADPAPMRADGDVVVARRGSAEVTLAEVDARMEELPVDQRAGFMNSPERIDTTLQQLLLTEQLADAAVEAGLDRDPRLAAQLELLRKRLLSGLQMEHMRKQAQAGVDVTAIARERYAADRGRFVEPETRSVRHVLVSTSKRTDAEATARVAELQRRLAAGETLAALAAELSDDEGSRSGGGLIADIPRGRTDPAFEEATFALRTPGEVTPAPVQSQFGFHLIELVSVKPERQRAFEEVRAELEAAALEQVVDGKLRAYSDGLNGLPIEADPDVVESLRTRYGAVQPLPADAPANDPSQAAAQQRR